MNIHHELSRLLALGCVAALLTVAFCNGHAQTRGCSVRDAMRAETEASSLKDWHSVFASYKRYWRCDDAAIAGGYSASVARLLSDQWTEFGQLIALTKSNPKFQALVLKHIDATMGSEQYLAIRKNTRSDYPPDGQKRCKLNSND